MIRWLVVALILSSCGPRIIHFVNEDARLRDFQSYVIVALKGQNVGEAPDQAVVFRRIESYISDEMTRRGYTTDNQNPDLVLRYEIVSGTRTERNNNNMSFYYVPPTNRQIIESIILIEMTDFNSKKLVWHASLDLREHSRLTKRKDPLQAAFAKMFDTYLYRAGSNQPDQSLISK